MVLNYLPYYGQPVRIYTYKKSLGGLLAGDYALVFDLGYLVCLISLDLFPGKKIKRSVTLTSLVLANLALCLPLLYETTQVSIF